ncbi:hypothetical protein ABW20_dc0102908 [Dactylellina cionopaga]|nr:hypothetical protein ABW20_dc0102908 [Dactylellina cionopaga]
MVELKVVRDSNTRIAAAATKPLNAVIANATAGIGDYTARALARAYKSSKTGLRLFILGRNAKAAAKTAAACQQACPNSEFTFVQVEDLRLLSDVDKVCDKLTAELKGQSIDLLVLTTGVVVFGDRKDTIEGLDFSMSLLYYSRIRFILRLMPLLEASTVPAGAHVVSVYAAGNEQKLIADDLSLRHPGNYTFNQCRSQVVFMKRAYFAHLAECHPKVSFAHVYPGLVPGPNFTAPTMPLWFRILWVTMIYPLCRIFRVFNMPDDCGDRVVYIGTSERFPSSGAENPAPAERVCEGTNGEKGSGAYSLELGGEKSQNNKHWKEADTNGNLASKLVEHTDAVMAAADKCVRFVE